MVIGLSCAASVFCEQHGSELRVLPTFLRSIRFYGTSCGFLIQESYHKIGQICAAGITAKQDQNHIC